MPSVFTVRFVGLPEVEAYCAVIRAADADSGLGGQPHSHVYGKDYPYDAEEVVARARKRWSTPLTEPHWRRGLGCYRDGVLVGHLDLIGGALPSELHRVGIGMGLLPAHRGLGGGSALLMAAIDWARAEPQVVWLDLGVFGENTVAKRMYRKHGFIEMGRHPDRFRVDGVVLENIDMSLFVG